MKFCVEHGIVPDFHAEIENGDWVYDALVPLRERYGFTGITLVASLSVDPNTGQNKYMKDMNPGQVWYGNSGEEPIPLKNDRPSPAFQGLVKALFRDAFIAAGIDYSFAYDAEGIAGTQARLASAKTERTFRGRWKLLNDIALQPIYTRWFLHELEQGRWEDKLSKKTLSNMTWLNPRWVRPAHPTADVGRESAADMAATGYEVERVKVLLP